MNYQPISVSPQRLDVRGYKEKLKSDYRGLLDTNWESKWTRQSPDIIQDQYGFTIEQTKDPQNGKQYNLSWKGNHIIQVNRMVTCKLLACVILNDIVLFNDTPQNEK